MILIIILDGGNMLITMQGYVDFGRFDKFNLFVAGSGHVDFVQVSLAKIEFATQYS